MKFLSDLMESPVLLKPKFFHLILEEFPGTQLICVLTVFYTHTEDIFSSGLNEGDVLNRLAISEPRQELGGHVERPQPVAAVVSFHYNK